MTNLVNKSLIAALSFLFVMAFSPITNAAENPFGMSSIDTDQITVAEKDKCGEGKCGGSKKKEGKCGDSKKKEGKCGEGKCGGDKKKEGKCGDSKKKESKCGGGKEKAGKCGEGKCGGN